MRDESDNFWVNPETNAQPPVAFTGLKLGSPKTVAVGLPAILSSAKYVFGAMNVVRGTKALLTMNQKDGFDCPSCAWPDPDQKRSVAEFCENGAKALADEATTHTASPVLFQRYSVEELAQKSDHWLGQQGRLTQPMLLNENATHYQKINWNDAFDLIANELKSLSNPDEAVFYTSGRSSNEAAFLYQLMVRRFGTNNLPDCSNMCHESSGVALTETLGLGKGSVTLKDFAKADVIIILGQNPGTNHPRMLTALQEAKFEGVKIVSVNPLKEAGLLAFTNPQHPTEFVTGPTSLTDYYLQIKINTDMALLKALIKLLIDAENKNPGQVLDNEFITNKTLGFAALKKDLENYDLDALIATTGLDKKQVIEVAELLATRKKIIACWAMGLTQHKDAVWTIRELVNLLLIKGSIGKEGAGTCPVRGHSNVQGDRTMGINEKPPKQFLDNLRDVFGFEPPRVFGYDVVEAIHAMHAKKAKVFLALGGNFISATPDTEFTAKAIKNCDLTVHISTKLNRSHLIHGRRALILPCLGRSDKDGGQFLTVENSMGVVHQSKGNLTPPSEHLLSEPAIVANIAKRLLGENNPIDWKKTAKNYDMIREMIEKTVSGFTHFNTTVRQAGGFYLPNGPREGKFTNQEAKAKFTTNSFTDWHLADDEFLMMTIRTHDQFNTTIYGLNDRYRGIYNERRVILMNISDIEKANLKARQVVDIHNFEAGTHRIARQFIVIPYNIPNGCVATYFPETNVLIPISSVADKSGTPTSKSVIVKISSAKNS